MEEPEDQPKKTLRVGVFSRFGNADLAVARLHEAGFPKDHLSVICSSCVPDELQTYVQKPPAGARSGEAAASGGAIGAVLGGLVALAGVVATGGMALFAAGALAVSGAGAGAIWGGLIGAMMTRGTEDEATNFYDQAVRNGKILVAVEADEDERLAEAERILSACGAEPIPLTKG